MSEFKTLTNDEVIEKTTKLVSEERRITTEVLQCLREVESRMIFAKLGYSSLYEFCVKHLHYSEGSAYRRISAMRLLKDLPREEIQKIESKIKEGSVSVTNLSMLHSFIKTEKKESGKIYSNDEKTKLLISIEHQSKRSVEKQLAVLQPKILSQFSERILSDTLTEIKIITNEKLLQKLTRIREITAHSNPYANHVEIIEKLADDFLERHDPLLKAERIRARSKSVKKITLNLLDSQQLLKHREPSPKTSLATKPCVNEKAPSDPKISTRYIPASIRHQVWLRDQGKCSYQNQKQSCNSRYGLEIDHIKPYSLGGNHEIKNLRLLCRTHNQARVLLPSQSMQK